MATLAPQSGPGQGFEDYSMYSGLSDEELIQLAIERSMTDNCSSPTVSHFYSPPEENSEPSEDYLHMRRENQRFQRQATLHNLDTSSSVNPPETTNLPSQEAQSSHVCAEDRLKVLSWKRKRNGGLEVTFKPVENLPAVMTAILMNDTKTLLQVLQTQPSDILNTPSKEGWIHIHEAAYYGHEECLRILVNAFHSMINTRTKKRQTPLLLAVTRNHLPCVQFLLEAGADPNIANSSGETPLYRACEKANEEMVDLLLRSGAKPSQANADGQTPLHEAVRLKSVAICSLLLNAGANFRARNMYRIEPLFMAAQGGGAEVLSFLIKHGACFECQAKDGATPLYEASKNGHEEVVKVLLPKGVDVNKTTKSGLTPLHVAAKNGHARIVSLLIPHTDRALIQKSRISPLHLAAEHNRSVVLEILLDAGFAVNTVLKSTHSHIYDDQCCTALHFTVRNSNIDAASMLLEAGADPNVDTFNPLLVAVRKGNAPMVSLLVEYGANVNACVPTHPTTFPGALLFCMKHTPMLKFLLDNGCNADACFYCVYGGNPHPPIKRRLATRDELDLDGDSDSQPAQFCEILADPLYSSRAGPVIDRLLDYTGPVKLCSRITELLESNEDWMYIKEKLRPTFFSLMHLCRLRIRQQLGHQRLRQIVSLPLPGRLIKYLFYVSGESQDLFSYCFE